jgi:hypothetical protein
MRERLLYTHVIDNSSRSFDARLRVLSLRFPDALVDCFTLVVNTA